MRRAMVAVATVSLAVLSTLAVPAAPQPAPAGYPTLADFDIRTAQFAARSALTPTARDRAAKRPELGGAEIRWSATTGGPRAIVPVRGPLAEARDGAPAEIARDFVRENRDLYRLDDADLAGLRLVREYVTRDTGVTHLTFVQEADGRRVVGADLRIAVDALGRVVWAAGELVPGASSLAKRDGWSLDAVEGSVAAARAIDAAAEPREIAGKTGSLGETLVELGDAFVEPARARQTLFPIAPGALRPAWTVFMAEKGPGNMYVVTVDAEKGTLLARHNLTRYAQDPKRAQFRVFTKDSPQPNIPRTPTTPQSIDRELVALTPAILDASPNGWIGSEPVTSGNNARAQEDRDANNSGGVMGIGDTDFVFDPALDFPIKTNGDNTDAAIVNLFYWCNWIHDYLYRLGFDEGSGNFQLVNVTGEGRGGDPVVADAQDGAGLNNANFGTPPDGFAPRMQMFLWSGGFDGSFDTTIIIHEYVHGLSTRLIGGPDYVDGLTGPQSGGMGEGWSDWYSLTMLADPAADIDADYVVGAYSTRDFLSGVRSRPYTTNMQRNPLTYSDIDPATSNGFNDPTEVHNVGEVWCSTLWEMRAKLIEAYGPAEGRQLAEQLVTDGMKFSANNPSFVDARDGILVADQVRTGGANQCLIWEGFAKRGVGYSAFTLNGSATAVKESFDLPPWCESQGVPSFDRTSYGESDTTAVLRVGDSDLAGDPSVTVDVTSSSGDRERVTLAGAERIPGLFESAIAIRRGAAALENGTLDVALGDTITIAYSDASSGPEMTTATARVVRSVSLFRDQLEQGTASWKPGRWQLTTAAFASPSHSWHESPSGNYADLTTYRLQLKQKFDLTRAIGSQLVFEHRIDTEPGYDLCLVEARAKGKNWTTLAVFSGTQTTFEPVTIDLGEFDGLKGVKIRFSLVSDPFVNGDGWYIDDVEIKTGRTE